MMQQQMVPFEQSVYYNIYFKLYNMILQ